MKKYQVFEVKNMSTGNTYKFKIATEGMTERQIDKALDYLYERQCKGFNEQSCIHTF